MLSSSKSARRPSNVSPNYPACADYDAPVVAMAVPQASFVDDKKSSSHHNHSEAEYADANTQNIKQWPPALRNKIIATFKKPHDEKTAGAFLQSFQWPEGLKSTVYKSCKKIPMRFIIIDDSGDI